MIWEPFQRAQLPPQTPESLAEKAGVTIEQARYALEHEHRQLESVWMNNLYQVNVYRIKGMGPALAGQPPFDLLWLSIKRRDKDSIHDWRHLQRIKTEIVGAEYEAVELYPAESRHVDLANQYHLWVVADPTFRFPFGFNERAVDVKEHNKGFRQRGDRE